MNIGDGYELNYYKSICDTQAKYISGEISKEELDSRCEIENQKYISVLKERNLQLQKDMENQIRIAALIESIGKK